MYSKAEMIRMFSCLDYGLQKNRGIAHRSTQLCSGKKNSLWPPPMCQALYLAHNLHNSLNNFIIKVSTSVLQIKKTKVQRT